MLENRYCKEDSGLVFPVVELNVCESRGFCKQVCPYHVFEILEIKEEQFAELSFVGKLKTLLYGREKAIVINPYSCHSCGLCVMACPENAINLTDFTLKPKPLD